MINSFAGTDDRIEELECFVVLQRRVVRPDDAEGRALLGAPKVVRYDRKAVFHRIRDFAVPRYNGTFITVQSRFAASMASAAVAGSLSFVPNPCHGSSSRIA